MAGLFPEHNATPKPKKKGGAGYGGPKTAAEMTAYRNKSGIAPTAQNMGSLAVQYRADAAAKTEAGEQTDAGMRAQKVIDTRKADKTKRDQNKIRAEQAFKKRAKPEWTGNPGRGLDPTGGASTVSNNRPGNRTSARGLGSAQAPKPYGLF